MQPIGILGGTFDPIHQGHIRLAIEACQQLDLQQVRFIPVHIPPHRHQPVACANDRKVMLELALGEHNEFIIDTRELESSSTSYTINTLKSLRSSYPETPLCLIMGEDAFAQIDSWFNWQELIDYAHIVVASRPGDTQALSTAIQQWTARHSAEKLQQLHSKAAGYIYFMNIPLIDVSATAIRSALAENRDVRQWLHESTLNYINQHQLYQDAA